MRRYHDTIVLGGNGTLDPAELTELAVLVLKAEYPRSTLLGVEWTFATTISEVREWPLPHDCDNCRDGKVKAIAALIDGSATVIALGNMLCSEPGRG